ncbi:FG-GAP-like repeat-containing protein [Saprospiraceae bacterium]|nr:FG-GAP-like repeat-containing protein [Saprospiraceae bacterium]
MNNTKLYIILGFIILLCSCSEQEKEDKHLEKDSLFSELDNSSTHVEFINEVKNSKDFNIFSYRNFYNGGGVSIGDINQDSLVDIYFTSNMGANKLYLNKGNFEFEDISSSAGIELTGKWSTGVTMVDINSDGLLDIYVCNAGYQKGQDQGNALFINQGNNSFKDEAKAYGLDYDDYSTHASFFDYDQDGDLDMYLLNNSFIPVNTLNYSNSREIRAKDWKVADFLKGGGDKLLRNDGEQFTDVSDEAGIYGSLIGFGLGTTVADVNNDGWQDIYVSNDFFEKDYLYINQQDGTFKENLEERISHISHSSMGADIADINNDGSPEIFVTDMLPDDNYRLKTTSTFDNINLRKLKEKNGFYNQYMHNTLQLNDGSGAFKEIGFYAGVAASDWSWGALMFDADNDSYNDIFISNGIVNDVIDQDFIDFFASEIIQKMVLSGTKEKVDSIISKMPSVPIINKLYRNTGNLKFEDIAVKSGINKATFSNGAAYGDLDNDGDLDLVVNNNNQPAQLFRNNSTSNYIGFNLEFKGKNQFALGATVQVHSNKQIQLRELMPSRGFQSSVDYKLNFGLGTQNEIDSVVIIWPNGQRQAIDDLAINEYHTIQYSDSNTHETKLLRQKVLFQEVSNSFPQHLEDDHTDFYYERNIPLELSKEGPCSAVGDFNGDGKDDLFIGGATDQAPQLYINTGNGYKLHQKEYFERFKAFEDTYACFVDVDNDNDLDLIVASGGNNVTYKKQAFYDRLYKNVDGKFEYTFNAFPKIPLNTSVIKPHDIDGDGDQDLFVGIRSIPGEYALSPGSFILMNRGNGMFVDVTKEVVPELQLAGMITDAEWADVLPQKGLELVLVGEWMSPKILSYDGKKMNIIESELSKQSGWWQSLEIEDIDNDGDQDLILGNIGENFYLKASNEDPTFIWINDFDDNGSIEKIITFRKEGKDYPVVVKKDLVDQIPMLKKENLMHTEFANKAINELFSKEKIASSVVKKVNNMSSMVAINNGSGDFEMRQLPAISQLSSINDILAYDVNGDGFQDFIIAGNTKHLLPQFSAIDACAGKILLNNKNGSFDVIDSHEAGFNMKGVVRELKILTMDGTPHIISLINNEKPQLYKKGSM